MAAPKIKVSAIRVPVDELQNHTIVLRQIKEAIEVAQRQRGDPQDSFVRVAELVQTQLVRFTNSQIQPALKDSYSLVANLPAAGNVGARAFVLDATSTTFLAAVVGGGTNKVPVVDNGTAWVIG